MHAGTDNPIQEPWVCIRVHHMKPNILGLWGQGFFIRFLNSKTDPK